MKDFIINYPSNILLKDITNQILKNSKSIFYHRTIENYKESPLHRLSALSNYLKISNLYVKDESNRFGLDSLYSIDSYRHSCIICHPQITNSTYFMGY